jgi:hypothetical protein
VFNPINDLREAGFPVDQLSDSQREVLADLTEEETAIVASVQHRLLQAEGDVVAQDLKMF